MCAKFLNDLHLNFIVFFGSSTQFRVGVFIGIPLKFPKVFVAFVQCCHKKMLSVLSHYRFVIKHLLLYHTPLLNSYVVLIPARFFQLIFMTFLSQ